MESIRSSFFHYTKAQLSTLYGRSHLFPAFVHIYGQDIFWNSKVILFLLFSFHTEGRANKIYWVADEKRGSWIQPEEKAMDGRLEIVFM